MKISKVLKETDIHQITGYLIEYNDKGEFMGKCAMGVLACESGKEDLKLDKQHTQVPFTNILGAYEIENQMYPRLNHPNINGEEVGWDFANEDLILSSLIVRLNDTYGFTFEQIGEFLEVTFDF